MTRTPKAYFEELYRHDPDPWGFATRWYETRKYAVTMASLPRPRYRAAFEPGCSIGVLTGMLATRCASVLAGDEDARALAEARTRTAGLTNVEVRPFTIPDDWPPGPFDLVVLSEIAYYFDEPGVGEVLRRALASLESAGTLVAVHWRGATDYPLSGERVHELIDARPGLAGLARHVEDEFVLGVWERR